MKFPLMVLSGLAVFLGCGLLIHQIPPPLRPSTIEPPLAKAPPPEVVEGPILDLFEQRFDKRFDERMSRLLDDEAKEGVGSIFVAKLVSLVGKTVKVVLQTILAGTLISLFWDHPYAVTGIFALAVNLAATPLFLLLMLLRRK